MRQKASTPHTHKKNSFFPEYIYKRKLFFISSVKIQISQNMSQTIHIIERLPQRFRKYNKRKKLRWAVCGTKNITAAPKDSLKVYNYTSINVKTSRRWS